MFLPREEYVEQAYFFRILGERLQQQMSTQDLLVSIREELLSTTRLPMAVDFMAGELRLNGVFAPAMGRLGHYFTPFQTYVVSEAEREKGMFDFTIALEILQREAEYRAKGATPQGIFLYQFEAISRNRLGYDRGLEAVAGDPCFDEGWREWIRTVRRQIGVVDFADLIYVRSELYQKERRRQGLEPELDRPVLFGEKEGQIALANRRKDPLLLFSALQRQLDYPAVPRHKPVDDTRQVLPALMRRLERLESRLRLVEEEQRGGIDLAKFYARPGEEDKPLE
jgi:hypothetical protein